MKRQIVDRQLSSSFPHTPGGLPSPAACAVIRFNMLIVSAIPDIAAHSDFEEPESRAG